MPQRWAVLPVSPIYRCWCTRIRREEMRHPGTFVCHVCGRHCAPWTGLLIQNRTHRCWDPSPNGLTPYKKNMLVFRQMLSRPQAHSMCLKYEMDPYIGLSSAAPQTGTCLLLHLSLGGSSPSSPEVPISLTDSTLPEALLHPELITLVIHHNVLSSLLRLSEPTEFNITSFFFE